MRKKTSAIGGVTRKARTGNAYRDGLRTTARHGSQAGGKEIEIGLWTTRDRSTGRFTALKKSGGTLNSLKLER